MQRHLKRLIIQIISLFVQEGKHISVACDLHHVGEQPLEQKRILYREKMRSKKLQTRAMCGMLLMMENSNVSLRL